MGLFRRHRNRRHYRDHSPPHHPPPHHPPPDDLPPHYREPPYSGRPPIDTFTQMPKPVPQTVGPPPYNPEYLQSAPTAHSMSPEAPMLPREIFYEDRYEYGSCGGQYREPPRGHKGCNYRRSRGHC
eukprot:CFRG6854T1